MAMKTIVTYALPSGKEPLTEWLGEQDEKIKSIVYTRIDRMRLGNFGDCKPLKNGHGIWELRIDYGPGYRIYFGRKGDQIVILLLGGNKASQTRDITKAKRYWLDFSGDSDD